MRKIEWALLTLKCGVCRVVANTEGDGWLVASCEAQEKGWKEVEGSKPVYPARLSKLATMVALLGTKTGDSEIEKLGSFDSLEEVVNEIEKKGKDLTSDNWAAELAGLSEEVEFVGEGGKENADSTVNDGTKSGLWTAETTEGEEETYGGSD